jgi:PTH1 family peptidyl-tRNA hydrolase
MKYLIVGLGNIGPEYTLTRHNIGFQVVDHLTAQQKIGFQPDRLAFFASCKYRGKSLHFIKPTTYMNHSGKAVRYWLDKLKLPIENLLVIVDDIALPFGKLRMRNQGSSAGHNGLKSLETHLGTQAYARLKFGIGDNFAKGQQADYVLASFNKQELDTLQTHIDQACEMVYSFCTIGTSQTMMKYN